MFPHLTKLNVLFDFEDEHLKQNCFSQSHTFSSIEIKYDKRRNKITLQKDGDYICLLTFNDSMFCWICYAPNDDRRIKTTACNHS